MVMRQANIQLKYNKPSLNIKCVVRAKSNKPNPGKRNEAVLFKCADGKGLWISHMKCTDSTKTTGASAKPSLKLPATLALPGDLVGGLPEVPAPSLYVPFGKRPSTFQEVIVLVLIFTSLPFLCLSSFVRFLYSCSTPVDIKAILAWAMNGNFLEEQKMGDFRMRSTWSRA